MAYYKCECGSETFVKVYNVWNIKIKVDVNEENGEEFWDVEEYGVCKDHLYGYRCMECGKDAQELNGGL
jgi:hypothetical protein